MASRGGYSRTVQVGLAAEADLSSDDYDRKVQRWRGESARVVGRHAHRQSPPRDDRDDFTAQVVGHEIGSQGLAELQAKRQRIQEKAHESPQNQRDLVEAMEAETVATRFALSRAGAPSSPYADRGSPRRTPSPRSPAVGLTDSQRRVQFGADRTLEFNQTAAERLSQRCEDVVSVIIGAFDDGHASLNTMIRTLRDMDPENTGLINAGEFGYAIEDMELGLTVQEIDELVEALDARGSEVVEYNELLGALGAPYEDEPTYAGHVSQQPEEQEVKPEPEPEPEPVSHARRARRAEVDAAIQDVAPSPSRARRAEANALARAVATGAGAARGFEDVLQTTGVDPLDPHSINALAEFNDQLEAEVQRGKVQSGGGGGCGRTEGGVGKASGRKMTRKAALEMKKPAGERRKPKLTGRAAEVAANSNVKPRGEVADLWECTFEPNTRPQVLVSARHNPKHNLIEQGDL